MRPISLQVLLLFALILTGCATNDQALDEDAMIDQHVASLREAVAGQVAAPRPQVMLLGTFHFANPGADAHKSKYTFDVFSPDGQKQLSEVIGRLNQFRPTKILVERGSEHQAQIDEWYNSYLAGKQANIANEIVTIGFALAKRLGHTVVYGFDADGVWLPTAPDTREKLIETAKRLGKEDALDDPTYKRYAVMYKQGDEIEETLTLRQRLRLLNHPDYVRLSHGSYFFWSAFRVSDGKEYPGPDGFISMWHNRNIRMFANMQRLASDPDDRVLVIVGAGHLPILQHCVQSCPTMKWVAVDEYLGAR
jgi:hypothetical protein